LHEKFQPYFCEVLWAIDGAETMFFREQFIDWGLDNDGIEEDHKGKLIRNENCCFFLKFLFSLFLFSFFAINSVYA